MIFEKIFCLFQKKYLYTIKTQIYLMKMNSSIVENHFLSKIKLRGGEFKMRLNMNKKSFMSFGKWSLVLTFISLLGYFFVNFMFSSLASLTPGNNAAYLNISAADSNQTDYFYTCGNVVYIRFNISCSVPGSTTVCNESLTASANFTNIGGSWKQGYKISNVDGTDTDNDGCDTPGVCGWRLFEFNSTVDCTSLTITNFQGANVTINASTYDGNTTALWTMPILVNMSTLPSCPTNPGPGEIPSVVPLLNGTPVQIFGCNAACSGNNRAEANATGQYFVCAPTFGGATTNFTAVAYNGNFSAVPLVIDIPGKGKINFTTGVNMSTQQGSSSIMQFAMKSLMTGGKIGLNDSEWNGQGNMPNLTMGARITIYNATGQASIAGRPQIMRYNHGSTAGSMCPQNTCSNFVWDGQNVTFTVSGFSDYGLNDTINVTLGTPSNNAYTNVVNTNFTFTPVWATDVIMKNCSLFTNYTGTWQLNSSNSTPLVNGVTNGININLENNAVYIWNVYCYDTSNQYDYDLTNRTITFDDVLPKSYSNATSRASGVNYTRNANYGFQINWTDENAVDDVILEWNAATNYSYLKSEVTKASNTYSRNITDLAAGTYTFKWYANDSANNWNSTNSVTFIIYNATNVVHLYFRNSTDEYADQNMTITYGTQSNATGTSSSGTVYVSRNNTVKASGTSPKNDTLTLGAAVYQYVVNATGNANYTDNTTGLTYYIFVNKASPSISIGPLNVTYPTAAETGCERITGDSSSVIALYRNGTFVANGTSSPQNATNGTSITIAVGVYNYTCTITATQNYTASTSANQYGYVSKGTLNLSISGSDVTYPTNVSITLTESNTGDDDVNYTLYINTSTLLVNFSTTNGTAPAGDNERLNPGSYLYTFNTTAGPFTNWTANSSGVTQTVIVGSAPVTTTTEGGGGGGGGGTTPPKEKKKSQSWDKITPGSAEIMHVDDPEIGLKMINITVRNPVQTVTITVTKLAGQPASVVHTISGKVYKYIEIKGDNINETHIDKVKIQFQVNKSWISSNRISRSTIALNRYKNDNWQKLTTKELSEDNDYVYYEAETPGFSTFAVTGEEIVATTVVTTTAVATTATTPRMTTIPTTPTEVGRTLNWIPLLIVIVVIIIIAFFMYRSNTEMRKRKKSKDSVNILSL
jgi:PGF-pre-PGF domain-containing protein